jgi:hypothetical protein
VWCRWVWVLLRGEVELESLHTQKIQQRGELSTLGRGGENRGGWWQCSPLNRIRLAMEGWTIGQVGLLLRRTRGQSGASVSVSHMRIAAATRPARRRQPGLAPVAICSMQRTRAEARAWRCPLAVVRKVRWRDVVPWRPHGGGMRAIRQQALVLSGSARASRRLAVVQR